MFGTSDTMGMMAYQSDFMGSPHRREANQAAIERRKPWKSLCPTASGEEMMLH
jgi:hypothetical protein